MLVGDLAHLALDSREAARDLLEFGHYLGGASVAGHG